MLREPSTDLIRKIGNTIQKSTSNTKKLSLSEQQIIEWVKCRNNILYFIYHYVRFETAGNNVDSYKNGENFHPKLKRYVRSIYNYHTSVLMASRQLGKSTINAAILAWSTIFFPKNSAIILNFKKEAALENLKKIKFIINELPPFLKLETTSKSDIKTYADYSNGSVIKVFYPTTVHTKETIARSLSSPILYVDEPAFIPDMHEVFGSAQPILSTAREQAKKNNYPYFIGLSCTPNGIEGAGKWFYERWSNGIESDLLFEPDPNNPKNERWIKDPQRVIKDPSKNGFIRVKYHWSEDKKKDTSWYNEQCRELSDKRKVNQELDLIFVGSSNCIFDDELLASFEATPKVNLIDCPHETNMVVYKKDLNPNDYYLIGVDTARSLGGAYNSIEVFSFSKFEQVAEFNFRLGSFNKYGQIIDFIFRWIQTQIGNSNIILAIENNTIGLAPIEYLLDNVTDINYRDYIYKEPKAKEWGVATTGISKDMMIGCLTEILKENPKVIHSQSLINQMSAIERNRGGSISSDTFSDLFMASSFCAYVRKMKAMEIMPLINLGVDVVEGERTKLFQSFINLNTYTVTPTDANDISNNNIFNERELENLMLIDTERHKRRFEDDNIERIDEFFSPF